MIVHEKRLEIAAVLGKWRSLTGDGEHVVSRIEAGFDECVFHERLVGQRLERGARFRDEDEKGMGDVDGAQHVRRIVRIDVADETGLHLQAAFGARPVLQRQVHGAGSQIASADADLNDGCERLVSCVGYLAVVHLVREFGDSLLLLDVELSFVNPVCHNGVA